MGQQRITLDHIIAAADCNDGAKNMNLNLKTLAAGLDGTFEWWGNQDSITVCRWYGQKLLRQATYWEPAEYTEETSETLTVKAEGSVVIILNDEGRELDREDFSEYHEEDHAEILADMIDAQIPWRDLQKEADEAYSEWLIARAEDMEAA